MGNQGHEKGQSVSAYCRRCKRKESATVTSVVDGTVTTVVCETCHQRQRYKARKPTTRGRVRVVDVAAAKPRRRERKDTPLRPLSHTGGKHETPLSEPVARSIGQRKKPLTDKGDAVQRRRWRQATEGVHSRFARPHREGDSYVVDELILHKVYGMGVIEAVDGTGTMKVLFREGVFVLSSAPSGARAKETAVSKGPLATSMAP